MTQEEKAKAYDEALERAKNLHKDAITLQLEQDIKDYEYIFPELKESEDERIKKEIVELIMQPTWKTEKEFNRRKELVAWLENQGEQKPATIDIDKMVYDYANNKERGNEEFGKPVPCMIRAYRQGINDALRLSLNLEKQDEQQSTDNKEKLDVLNFIRKETCCGLAEANNALLELIKVLKEHPLPIMDKPRKLKIEWEEQKPQRMVSAEAKEALYDKPAWSEKDTSLCIRIQGILSVYKSNSLLSPDLCKEMCDWLKSIKDRVQPQPKQEWSEEDEEAIEMAIIALEDMYDEDEPDTTYGGYNLPFNKAAERLKSLKERIGG